MAKQDDNTAPASEALAVYDKIFAQRELLNQTLDVGDDSAYHVPNGTVPAKSVEELDLALTLLQQAITFIDRADNRTAGITIEGGDPPEDFAIPNLIGERRADRDKRVHDILMAADKHAKHLRKAEGRLAKAKGLAETLRCALRSDDYDPEPFADEIAASIVDLLGKVQTQIDRHSRRHSNLFLAYCEQERSTSGGDWQRSALAAMDRLAIEHAEKTPQECAARLRKFNYDVAENLAASMSEDRYTVTKTWTPKGIRYFLAEREFMESLLSEDA